MYLDRACTPSMHALLQHEQLLSLPAPHPFLNVFEGICFKPVKQSGCEYNTNLGEEIHEHHVWHVYRISF